MSHATIPQLFKLIKPSAWKWSKKWVAHSKPVGSGEAAYRFLQHVLPSRFCKVRHYGLHHSSKRATIKLLQAMMSFALGRDLPKPVAIEKPPAMTCPERAAVMTFEKRYNRSQRLKYEMALPRGPPQ